LVKRQLARNAVLFVGILRRDRGLRRTDRPAVIVDRAQLSLRRPRPASELAGCPKPVRTLESRRRSDDASRLIVARRAIASRRGNHADRRRRLSPAHWPTCKPAD